jgi:hypothetical protein
MVVTVVVVVMMVMMVVMVVISRTMAREGASEDCRQGPVKPIGPHCMQAL